MSIPSLIFFSVFLLPLVAFLVWVMRQDKRRGVVGLLVLLFLVVGGIVYMYLRTVKKSDANAAQDYRNRIIKE